MNRVDFLKETSERAKDLFTREHVRHNYYSIIKRVTEVEGVERAARIRWNIEQIIGLSGERAGKQWYTGFIEDIDKEVKKDISEAEKTIDVVKRAIEGEGTAPGRIVKTQDRVRLDIPDAMIDELFDKESIQLGDIVLIVYERPEVKFKTIAKYGEGGIKGFHALLEDGAEQYKGKYGIVTIRKLTNELFMEFWKERSQYQKIAVEKEGDKWYVIIDGIRLKMVFEGLGDAGGYIYEETNVGKFSMRYYKDGRIAIAREATGKKPTFRTIADVEYDRNMEELVIKLQGREETYRIRSNDA